MVQLLFFFFGGRSARNPPTFRVPTVNYTIIYNVIRIGIAAVVRSYVSESTTEKERTGALAGVSSAQAIGFILGPGKYILNMQHLCVVWGGGRLDSANWGSTSNT